MRIYKYELDLQDRVCIDMPKGARALTVQMQRGVPCIWAIVEQYADTEERAFRVYGTGQQMDDPGEYIGTFQMQEGALVFHVFEEKAK